MTDDDIIDGVLAREKEGDAAQGYLVAGDAGGRTSWGISERWHPELWNPGPPTREQARVCYFEAYVAPFDGLKAASGRLEGLRVQLVDFGVLSGVQTATMALQRVLDVAVDGQLGAVTLAALDRAAARHVNNELVLERIKLEEADIARRPSDRGFEHGWMTRALAFYSA